MVEIDGMLSGEEEVPERVLSAAWGVKWGSGGGRVVVQDHMRSQMADRGHNYPRMVSAVDRMDNVHAPVQRCKHHMGERWVVVERIRNMDMERNRARRVAVVVEQGRVDGRRMGGQESI